MPRTKAMRLVKIVGIALAVVALISIAAIWLAFDVHPAYNPGPYNASLQTTSYQNSISLAWSKINGLKAAVPIGTPTGIGFETTNRRFALYSLANSSLYAASNITYCTYRGKPLLMDLYANRPLSSADEANGTRPIALYIFGGGYTSGNKTRFNGDMTPLILNLVGRGYVVASINYLLAPNYTYPNQTNDVLCAMRFLRYYSYSFNGNQNQIGTFGNSVGGTISALAAVLNGTTQWQNPTDLIMAGDITHAEYVGIPTRPYAAVDYYGSGRMPDSQLELSALITLMGPGPAAMFMQAFNGNATLTSWASPTDFVVRGEPPILIVQGNNDTLTLKSETIGLYDKLKSLGNDVSFIMVYNGDHELVPNPPNSTIHPSLGNVTNTTVMFLISHLLNPTSVSTAIPKIIITPLNESTNSGSGSQGAPTQAHYTRLYAGQSISYNNFVIRLVNVTVTNGTRVALIHISTNHNFTKMAGDKQYVDLGAFYLLVNQTNVTASSQWATVSESLTIPNGFVNSTYNSGISG